MQGLRYNIYFYCLLILKLMPLEGQLSTCSSQTPKTYDGTNSSSVSPDMADILQGTDVGSQRYSSYA